MPALTIKGDINYAISYAATTPEALDTFFVIAETKMVGSMIDQSWAQLLSYMGLFLLVCGRALLMMEKEYEFSRINDQLKV